MTAQLLFGPCDGWEDRSIIDGWKLPAVLKMPYDKGRVTEYLLFAEHEDKATYVWTGVNDKLIEVLKKEGRGL